MARLQDKDYRSVVVSSITDPAIFIGATFSGRVRKVLEFEKVTLRAIMLRGAAHIQFAFFHGKQVTHRNVPLGELPGAVDELLGMGYAQIHVRCADGDVHVKIGRKDKIFISKGKPSAEAAPEATHDRSREYLLPPDPTDPLLREIGMLSGDGRLRSGMRAKFKQVNEFLRIVDQVVPEKGPLHLVDCGCGSAWLTFAAYRYLHGIKGREVTVDGVDANPDVIQKNRELAERLQWDGMTFHEGTIRDFKPTAAPSIVFGLHACDTATDEAIAQGILWKAEAILAAPCCQHDLHTQFTADPLKPILRYGILRERLIDILTDTFRALALQVMGYRTAVVEFVGSAHTPRNLMIRADRPSAGRSAGAVAEYTALKAFCNVTPAIEELLGPAFQEQLGER